MDQQIVTRGNWQRILRADEALLRRVRSWELPWVTAMMRYLTRLGDAGSWVVVGSVLIASGREGAHHALLLGFGAGIATLFAQTLKRLCRRPRPTSRIGGFVALTENPDTFSFPSGHTAVAFGVAIALAGQGYALGALMALLAVGVGVSRVYLGAHYPLDVAVGAVLGIASGVLARLAIL